jgi:apolipoprotein D and lipocalin family protein
VNLRRRLACALLAMAAAGGSGCSEAAQPEIAPAVHVDMGRYMGRWYVIASIPTTFERGGHNPVETYRLQPDGTVCTSFRFRPDGFDAPVKRIRSVASVVPGTGNAEWDVHLFGVLRFQYLVAWLAPDYSQVIVARDKRDHAWLMARTPTIPPEDYAAMLARLQRLGYDLSRVERAPQRWPETGPGKDAFEMSCD